MEEPIRKILSLTEKEYRAIIAGQEKLNGKSGAAAIGDALAAINMDEMERDMKHTVTATRGARRDRAVKVLGFLQGLRKTDLHPKDWMISKIPVIPPIFRPITAIGDHLISSDANLLYKDFLQLKKSYNKLIPEVGHDNMGEARLDLYDSVSSIFGLGDPVNPKTAARGVSGFIRKVIGNSPKCYDDATELLTRDGWVPFGTVTGEKEVATVNPNSGKFEWQLPQDTTHEPYCGIMVRTLTGKLDLLVTPNHQHWLECRQGKYGDKSPAKEAQWTKPQKIDAGCLVKLTKRVRYFNAAFGWEGVKPPTEFAGFKTNSEALASFVGWWVAEGWIDKTQVNLCQAKTSEHIVEIDLLLETLGLPFDRRVYTTNSVSEFHGAGYQSVWWVITVPEFTEWVRNNCGIGSENKFFSQEILSWDEPFLKKILSGYFKGDGEKRKVAECPSKNKTYYNRSELTNYGKRANTTSARLVDCFAELCMKIGLGFNCGTKTVYENKNWKPQYRFSVHGWNRVIVEYPEQTVWEKYSGHVHCVTVPNGLLIVRRNGKTAVSGNSGMFQAKVISKPQDVVGRGTIVANPELSMDEVGMPEDMAWRLYRPFVARRLSHSGLPTAQALKEIESRTNAAKSALDMEMKARPVIYSRAPAWHRYNIIAAHPRVMEGDAIHISPLVTKGIAGDFDGDQMNIHVPISDDAVHDAKHKLLPSKNLLSIRDFSTPMYSPSQEMILGLYSASTRAGEAAHKAMSHAELLAGLKAGTVHHHDTVEI
jgi:hypothetical protein